MYLASTVCRVFCIFFIGYPYVTLKLKKSLESVFMGSIFLVQVENIEDAPATEVLLAFPPSQFDHLALVKAAATVGKKRKKSYATLEVNPTEQPGAPNGTKYYAISLPKPLVKGETTTLEILYILTHSLEPFPVEITQSDPQLVYFHDSAIILSPYHIIQQATLVKTPTNKVESFTQVEPTHRSGAEVRYGPYEDRGPYSYSPIIIHFENNHPFAVVEELEREIEISHWGSVQVTEHYKLAHAGAKHKGVFSRLGYLKNAQKIMFQIYQLFTYLDCRMLLKLNVVLNMQLIIQACGQKMQWQIYRGQKKLYMFIRLYNTLYAFYCDHWSSFM